MDAATWDKRYDTSEMVWSKTPNQFVAEQLIELPPGRAVDLGAGEGRNALWLAEQGWQVTAVDFSAKAIDRARSLDLAGRVDWVVGDVLEVPLPSELDLVLFSYLQLPAEQRRVALRRAAESLAPGGTLLFVAHDLSNLTEGTGGPQDPAVLPTADAVLADFEGFDLTVELAGRVPRTVSVSDEHGGDSERTAWDLLVRVAAS